MQEVIQFLNENPVQYLATVGRDGKAKCRPFMFSGEKDGKLWFCTNNTKEVYQDMLANPEIELSVASPAYAWIRLNGKAVFEDNRAVKEMCLENPIVKGQYQTPDNPIFVVFYLANAHAVIADFSGNPPQATTL
ncbi:pyridoxamine 5'-phosphate oxidase family protein [Holdemania filiformis]|uniref:pyridoxamine 5'-phosphate oxidase family protein n=1 Tax=Holdemania filiformis TaxID=61171 RepID=UPI00266E9F9D|nr:pyridoxamine 5'-phosphate oxidase family protein [Holdemania filiformis]